MRDLSCARGVVARFGLAGDRMSASSLLAAYTVDAGGSVAEVPQVVEPDGRQIGPGHLGKAFANA